MAKIKDLAVLNEGDKIKITDPEFQLFEVEGLVRDTMIPDPTCEFIRVEAYPDGSSMKILNIYQADVELGVTTVERIDGKKSASLKRKARPFDTDISSNVYQVRVLGNILGTHPFFDELQVMDLQRVIDLNPGESTDVRVNYVDGEREETVTRVSSLKKKANEENITINGVKVNVRYDQDVTYMTKPWCVFVDEYIDNFDKGVMVGAGATREEAIEQASNVISRYSSASLKKKASIEIEQVYLNGVNFIWNGRPISMVGESLSYRDVPITEEYNYGVVQLKEAVQILDELESRGLIKEPYHFGYIYHFNNLR